MKKIVLLIILFSGCLKFGFSQSGKPDASFGSKGVVKTNIGCGYNYELLGKQMLLQSDGSIYIILQSAGQTLIAKKHSNGSSDLSYGENGFSALANVAPISAAMQPDGKIVVAGQKLNSGNNEYDLVRYNINGSLDNTFGDKGTKSTALLITSIAIQSDGKIVVTGSVSDNDNSYFAIARYNTNGSTDNSFLNDGKVVTDFGFSPGEGYPEYDVPNVVAIQSDGKIVVIGSVYNYFTNSQEMAIARYKSDGNLDKTFDTDGKQTTNFGSFENFGYSLAFQTDGKIVAAGYTNLDGNTYDFAIARYNANGKLDKTFNGNGKQTERISSADHNPNTVAIQKDGKIVVEGDTYNGSNNDFAVARYNADGSRDNTFATFGNLKTDFGSTDDYANSLAIQSDGKILVEGYSYTYTNTDAKSAFVIARYNANGSLDKTFDGDGKLTGFLRQGYTIYNSMAVQTDGKVVVAGYAWNGSNNDFAMARYNTDGSLDNTFSSDGKQTTSFGANDYANSVVIQNDGKIVAAGYTISDNSSFALARYNTDGSLDNTFSGDGKQTTRFSPSSDNFANSVALQSNGKIIVAGYTNTGAGSNNDIAVARYNSNGSLDNTFSSDGKQTTDISSSDDFGNSVAIQTNGKIVVAGRTWNGTNSDFALVRYNNDGNLDYTFDSDGKQTTDFGFSEDYANSIALQPDGKIVVAGHNGDFTMYKIAIARYNADGKLDPTFSSDGMQVTDFGLSDASANSVAIQTDGKIVTGGSSNNHFALAWFKADGSPDNSFSNNGIQVTGVSAAEDKIQGIVIANNKLYAAGYGTYPATLGVVTRYLLHENKAPTVSIISPTNNATYAAPATITINATAADVDGIIHSVKFYNGSTYLKTVFASPYTYTLSNLPAGTYLLTAKATDNAGGQTISTSVIVSVSGRAPIAMASSKSFYVKSNTDINNGISFKLSPNPTSKTLNIYTSGLQQDKQATVSVISSSGVLMKNIQSSGPAKEVQLDVSSLISGVYIIKVVCGDKMLYKQFVKCN